VFPNFFYHFCFVTELDLKLKCCLLPNSDYGVPAECLDRFCCSSKLPSHCSI